LCHGGTGGFQIRFVSGPLFLKGFFFLLGLVDGIIGIRFPVISSREGPDGQACHRHAEDEYEENQNFTNYCHGLLPFPRRYVFL
jgi:hypothetical protein